MQHTLSIDQLVGQKLGSYRVERLLGRGRLNAVYLARHPVQNSTVALTTFIIPEQLSAEARQRFMLRFTKEAAVLTTMRHPHLLPVYEYGEQFGYPYLVTPYMTQGSLADILKQQGRCTHTYVSHVLGQVASGLDYIHGRGAAHGTLKPANILLSKEQTMLVAGFGLMDMLQARGIERDDKPHAHLMSIADTLLVAPEYLAPEVVEGQPIDARSDIYALGIILFELLSGKPPFAPPLNATMLQVQQPLPSLHILCPDVPITLELVVNHALAHDPAQRFQHAGELAEAFTQVCRGLTHETQGKTSLPLLKSSAHVNAMHSTPEQDMFIGNWQLTPPIITGKISAIHASTEDPTPVLSAEPATGTADSWQIMPPIITAHLSAVNPVMEPPAHSIPSRSAHSDATPQESVPSAQSQAPAPTSASVSRDSNTASIQTPAQLARALTSPSTSSQPETGTLRSTPPSPKSSRPSTKRFNYRNRRQVVALLTAGGVAAAGTFVAVHLNLAHLMNTITPPHPSQAGSGPSSTSTGKQTPSGKGTSTSIQQKPPLTHTGTVIGSEKSTINSSTAFNNPTDGKPSLLIHLPGGAFVAYERACTHEGVSVNYDSATHTLICPAHGAIFDPANGGKVLQGPATSPLPRVTVRVNADGTITTG